MCWEEQGVTYNSEADDNKVWTLTTRREREKVSKKRVDVLGWRGIILWWKDTDYDYTVQLKANSFFSRVRFLVSNARRTVKYQSREIIHIQGAERKGVLYCGVEKRIMG